MWKNILTLFLVLIIVLSLAACATPAPTTSPTPTPTPTPIVLPPVVDVSFLIVNPSFESGNTGWGNLITGNVEYFAPVDGKIYAISKSGADSTSQIIDITIEPGKTYTLTVWAKSIYSDDHIEALLGDWRDCPSGNAARVVAEVQLVAGSAPITTVSVDVSPVALFGAPEDFTNDDGGNVWIDGGYRHEFEGNRFIQPHRIQPPLPSYLNIILFGFLLFR